MHCASFLSCLSIWLSAVMFVYPLTTVFVLISIGVVLGRITKIV